MIKKNKEKKPAEWDPKRPAKLVQKLFTLFKSLMGLVSLCILATVFIFYGDDMFGMFLLIPAALTAVLSYVFSAVCLLMNFFSTKLFPKLWNILSLGSLVLLGIVCLIGIEFTVPGFTYYLCVCIGVQCAPAVIEVHEFEKRRSEKREQG